MVVGVDKIVQVESKEVTGWRGMKIGRLKKEE